MTKERISEIKNISNRRGLYTESAICECLDECVDDIERLQNRQAVLQMELDAERDKHAWSVSAPMLEARIEQCVADKDRITEEKARLIAEVYRLNETIAKAKAAFEIPGEAYSDERTAIRMMEVLEGKP